MRITIRFFAMQRAQTGLRQHALELSEGADVNAAWQALALQFPEIEPAGSSVRFARNGRYVASDAVLVEGDELAVIPPVAGGSDAGDPGRRFRRIEISEASLDDGLIAEMHAAVASPADGAIAMFLGQTRVTPGTPAPGQEGEAARFEGQRVAGLTYEAFEPMALTILEQIADEIEARYGVRRLAIAHRLGEVAVGESSVLIVVAAPHREEAFGACRYAIEELKARTPIWKAERFSDGSVWMGAPARSGPGEEPDA